MSEPQRIDVGVNFSRFPAGRYLTDGPFSGQRFREQLLVPALAKPGIIEIVLDNALGFGSSFLEESFVGLVRDHGYTADQVLDRFVFISRDQSLVSEIKEYIESARP